MKQLCFSIPKNRHSSAIRRSPDERAQSRPVSYTSVSAIVVCVMIHAPFISASQLVFCFSCS